MTAVTSDENQELGTLELIDVDECWRLLTTQPVGRFAIIQGRYPLVFPVNYVVSGKEIIFKTGAGAKLRGISRSNVTFEVDWVDPVHRTGWSVMVCGVAQEIEAAHNAPTPWAPGRRGRIVRIVADSVSGRKIHLAPLDPGTNGRGYI